jgi:hypothetical protein
MRMTICDFRGNALHRCVPGDFPHGGSPGPSCHDPHIPDDRAPQFLAISTPIVMSTGYPNPVDGYVLFCHQPSHTLSMNASWYRMTRKKERGTASRILVSQRPRHHFGAARSPLHAPGCSGPRYCCQRDHPTQFTNWVQERLLASLPPQRVRFRSSPSLRGFYPSGAIGRAPV